jgi:Transmembrane amino acid transporter protein
MFAFEGNGIVINLKASAKDKLRYPSLLRFAMLTIIIFFMIYATIAYTTYKDQAGKYDYITSNLPLTPLTIAIQILFCINALTSYPI